MCGVPDGVPLDKVQGEGGGGDQVRGAEHYQAPSRALCTGYTTMDWSDSFEDFTLNKFEMVLWINLNLFKGRVTG